MAAVIVGGTVASAVPGVRPSPSGTPPSVAPATPTAEPPSAKPTLEPTPEPSPSVTPSTVPPSVTPPSSGRGSPKPPTPTPTETGTPQEKDTSGAPDFSACNGLTGLENAICRHEVLVALHPDNKGLANALARLQANLAKQQAHDASKCSHGHGNPHGGGTD